MLIGLTPLALDTFLQIRCKGTLNQSKKQIFWYLHTAMGAKCEI